MLSSVLNSEVEISHYLRADLESHTFVNCSTTIWSLDYSVILWSLGYSVLAVSINFLLWEFGETRAYRKWKRLHTNVVQRIEGLSIPYQSLHLFSETRTSISDHHCVPFFSANVLDFFMDSLFIGLNLVPSGKIIIHTLIKI